MKKGLSKRGPNLIRPPFHVLPYCEFLDVVTVGRLDDVDTLVDDVGLDGLTRLDGEGLQREAGRRQDAHVGGVAK